MNLTFLSPFYLFGMLGMAAPILIHLLTRRQKKYQRFSAVYLLLQSKKRSIKRSIPNRRFLLFTRCMGIALLSLAMANPIFSFGNFTNSISNNPSASVFILDDSYSMGTRTNQESYYTHAVGALLNISGSLPSKSIYSVVLGSSPARVLQHWTATPEKVKKLLKSSQPTARTTEIGPAIKKALRLLESTSQKSKQIYILTDRDKNGWDEEEFSSIGKEIHYPINIIDFSGMRRGVNRAAVEHIEVQQEFLSNNRVIKVKMKAINLSQSKPLSKLKVSLWINGKKQTGGTLDIPIKSSVGKEFSFPLQDNTPLNGEVRIEDDSLLKDNLRFFSYQPDQIIKTLVVDGDPNTVEHQSETFYLERALSPFTPVLSNIELTLSTPAELSTRNLFNYSVIILCNVYDLPFGYEQELEKFVLRGGALFVALGDQVNAKFYNEKLGSILPVFLKAVHQITGDEEPFHFFVEPSKHPVLKVFKDQALDEMKSINFHSIYSVETRENSKFTVPIIFNNKFPALIESTTGKGKVILFVSSIDRDWNNFPIQPTFLPWIQRWIKYSARGLDSLMQKELLVGEPFYWQKPSENTNVYIVSPGGKVILPPSIGGKIVFKNTHLPGVYHLYRGSLSAGPEQRAVILPQLPYGTEPTGSFTINIDPTESSSAKISNVEIENLLPGANVTFSNGYQKFDTNKANEGVPISASFMILVGSMFLLEGWLIRKE